MELWYPDAQSHDPTRAQNPSPPAGRALAPWCTKPQSHQYLEAGSSHTSMPPALRCTVLCTPVHRGWVPSLYRALVAQCMESQFPTEECSGTCNVLQGTESWDPALPQPALERSPVPRGYTSTSLHTSQHLAETVSLLPLNYFLVFCSSSTLVNPWNFILCLLKPLVWITFMGDDNTARLGALSAGLTAQQLLVSLVCTAGQGTLSSYLPSPNGQTAACLYKIHCGQELDC